jgi:hypothetical protein
MELRLERKYKKETYTIGNLYVDGTWFCNTCEDKDRGLTQSMPLEMIKSKKVYGETAIPSGRYIVRLDIVSPKYSGVKWYKDNFGGRMPRLESVKGFSGILIHPGNSAIDSYGCIIVGLNKAKGKVLESRATFTKLWRLLEQARKRKETVYLTIE